MKMGSLKLTGGLAAFAAALLLPTPALAHCDGLDGPVVTAARKALDTGDPNGILIWVQPNDEAAVRAAFVEAIAVRKHGGQAQTMADRYFFETLVRLHRAGEGAPYTGLKPAGQDLGPAIPLADKAVASRSDRDLAAFLARDVEEGVHKRFAELQSKRRFKPDDLAAGRGYVASYVTFVHYVEGIHEAATKKPEGHFSEAPAHADIH